MDKETRNLVYALLPKVPLIARVCFLHVLRLSESAKYLDLVSAVTVSVIRSLIAPERPLSVSEVQRLTLRDPGIKGRIWVSKYAAPPPPETGVRDALLSAVDGLRAPADPSVESRKPDIVPVEAEWTGYRAGADAKSTLPPISEREKYEELMKECKSPVTILYFHGGAYYLLDPATHRPTTKKLAKLTGGRCYSVRYRLAPQNPFPSALLDALVSYLTLLYPPPDAFHEAVDPKNIVVAGDSAGGNLSLALLQTIIEIRRQNLRVMWFGEERELPLPGGMALSSPWVDMTLSSESWKTNAAFDYLPTEAAQRLDMVPRCEAWPADPPRMSYYADDAFLDHPLVTVALAADWRDAPPIYMSGGWELLADEQRFLASKLHASGVRVVFEEYEAMPHCFAMVLPRLPASRRCYDGWSGFIKSAVEDPKSIEPRAVTVKAKTLEEVELSLDSLGGLTEEQVADRIRAQIESFSAARPAKL